MRVCVWMSVVKTAVSDTKLATSAMIPCTGPSIGVDLLWALAVVVYPTTTVGVA
jgi:hypothetical protein